MQLTLICFYFSFIILFAMACIFFPGVNFNISLIMVLDKELNFISFYDYATRKYQSLRYFNNMFYNVICIMLSSGNF